MKSDVAPTLSNAPSAANTSDTVEQRRAATAALPDVCPGHDHEEAAGIELPDTLRHPSTAAGTKQYWRTPAELQNSPQFQELLEREFPKAASEWTDELSRRHFMKIMGASLALAGVAACTRRPEEIIVPYVVPPEQVIPGRPLFFATTYTMEGAGRGVIVESHEGRPTKIEGNPDHPASLGATSVHMQASILSMYDPDRVQAPKRTGDNSTWDRFVSEVLPKVDALRANGGEGLRLLMTPNTSPTVERQLKALLQQLPKAKVHVYDPLGVAGAVDASKQYLGQAVSTVYKFDKATRVVALDSNFMIEDEGSLAYARQFIDGRRVRADHHDAADMNRLYVVESTPTNTGAMADHRSRVSPGKVQAFAAALLAEIVTPGSAGSTEFSWLAACAKDLAANRGKSVVVAGPRTSVALQQLAYQINAALGNVGQTVVYTKSIYTDVPTGTLSELVSDANAGNVKLLFILGGNPAYDAPDTQNFVQALTKVDYKVRLGFYDDETTFQCHWHLPESHYLEMWSDARAFDGTASLVQPLIAPLYDTRSIHWVLGFLTGERDLSEYQLVRATWQSFQKSDFEIWWRETLNKGVIDGTAFADTEAMKINFAAPTAPAAGGADTYSVVFAPDPYVMDGRFSNNGWMQELPKLMTQLTWDNVVLMSYATATKLGVPVGDYWDDAWGYNVEIEVNGKKIIGPAWPLPGHADETVTLFLGYGKSRGGSVDTNVGFDVNPLRTTDTAWLATGATVKKVDGRLRLACTQMHHLMKGDQKRDLIRVNDIANYEKAMHGPYGPPAHHGHHEEGHDTHGDTHAAPTTAPALAAAGAAHHDDHAHDAGGEEISAYALKYKKVPLTLYNQVMPSDPPYRTDSNQWGMSIDTNACIGCNACVVACQSENNIPIVGKTEIVFGREMHWLRIDTYYGGNEVNDNVEGPFFQPLACMHCEAAPCEVVCPVAATQHDDEGLNVMTYNRCVGTKYCSNNCPYKVRRFNFFKYKDVENESIALMRNPNVSIRTRGVMEKCTFCIQRISAARIEAKKHDGPHGGPGTGKVVGDRTPMTACQQSCPTNSIVFGNLMDARADVVKLKMEPTDYTLLHELNTRPRVSYMGRFMNPNPEIGHG